MLSWRYRAWHPSGSIVPVPVYKAERVASGLRCLQSLHKDNKNFRDYQIGKISRGRLTLSAIVCVWCMCVSIASTSVTPEHRHRCRCKARVSTRTPICSQCLRIRLQSSGTHLRVLCVGSPTHQGRLIGIQPTLGLRVMSAADMVATVTAEQSDAPLWQRNLPPQLSKQSFVQKSSRFSEKSYP